jgi:hypothetical protein
MESVLSCHPEQRYAGFGGDPPTDMTAHPPSRRDACSTRGGLINRGLLWGSRPGCQVGGDVIPSERPVTAKPKGCSRKRAEGSVGRS